MNVFLLDVNVLIALLDPAHVQHDAAHRWFEQQGHRAWASCPLTQNGVLRIAGHARYPNTAGSAAAVAGLLGPLCRLPGHQFWADDLSPLERTRVDATRLLGSAQITGTCLLALACEHGARLASFDRRLVTDAVQDGAAHLHLIE